MKQKSEVYSIKNKGPKTLPCGTPDTTLTSLLRQPSTITCCDRFNRNCANTEKTEPPIPTEQSLFRMPRWLTLSKAGLKYICEIPASCQLSMHSAAYGTLTKVHHRYPDLSDKQTGWLEAHHWVPEIVQDDRHQAMLSKLVGNWQQRRKVDLSELG